MVLIDVVMSDWGAQKTTVESALAGLDMAMPGDGARNPYNSYWGGMLTEAILNGTIPEWRLDDSMQNSCLPFHESLFFKPFPSWYKLTPL